MENEPGTLGRGEKNNGGAAALGLMNRVVAGRYEILEMLGEGPLLAAFRARDQTQNRFVTLKTPLSAWAGRADVVSELRKGVAQTLSLAHAGIARVYDVGEEAEAEGGLFYIADEYVRGIDLKERIRRAAPFQLTAATDTAVVLAEALEFAHARGIAHGDVRPQNVLIGPDGQTKLSGWGVAEAQARVIAGNPNALRLVAPYIAPDLSVASASGDVYALGVILFELLTKEVPPIATTPDAASPRRINTGVPRALDGIVQRALGRTASQRYAGASEMLADLRAVRDALRYGKSLAWSPLDRPLPAAEVAAEPAPLPPSSLQAVREPMSDEGTIPARSVTIPLSAASDETLIMPTGGLTVPVTPRRSSVPVAAPVPPPTPPPSQQAVREPAALPRVMPAMGYPSDPLREEKETRPVRNGGSRWLTSLNLFLFVLLVGAVASLAYTTMQFLQPPGEVVVPNLVGKTETEAKNMAQEQKFDLARIDEQFRDVEPNGVIYQMSPVPGRHIRIGKPISIWVSKGPRMVEVPDVRDMGFDRAKRVLEKAGLRVGEYKGEWDPLAAKGNIIQQTPIPGENRPRGTRIDLVLSKGEEPPPPPVEVPTPEPLPDPSTSDLPSPPPTSENDRVRTFDIRYPRQGEIPNDATPHRVRVDVTDRDGTRTVFDETVKAGDHMKTRVEAIGKPVTIKLFDNDELRAEMNK